MAKETMKAIGIAAAETALKALMPHLQDTLSSVRDEVRAMRDRIDSVESKLGAKIESVESKLGAKIDSIEGRIRESEDKIEIKIDALRQEMFDRFEATRDTINELGLRISRVDGALEAYARIVHAAFPTPRPARPAPPPGSTRKRRAG
jgi:chromosome segregation ATPase